MVVFLVCVLVFFFNDTATTEIYTLSLHDALPILAGSAKHLSEADFSFCFRLMMIVRVDSLRLGKLTSMAMARSEEHTSELQSRQYLVCRLLLEKKKKQTYEAGRTACVGAGPT